MEKELEIKDLNKTYIFISQPMSGLNMDTIIRTRDKAKLCVMAKIAELLKIKVTREFMDQFVFKGRLALSAQTMQTIHVVFLVICMSGALTGVLTTVNTAVMGALTSVISLII